MLTNLEVIKKFISYEKGNNVNLKSTGDKLFSYSTVIAQWESMNTVLINDTKYSSTTSRHRSTLKRELDGKGKRIICIDNLPFNINDLMN